METDFKFGNQGEMAQQCWTKMTTVDEEALKDIIQGIILLAAETGLKRGIKPDPEKSHQAFDLMIEEAWKAGFRCAMSALACGAIKRVGGDQ
jgi:hypothetical protein